MRRCGAALRPGRSRRFCGFLHPGRQDTPMPLLLAADERGEQSASLGQAATDAAAKASPAPLPGTPRPPIDAPGEGDREGGDGGEEPERGQERCRSASARARRLRLLGAHMAALAGSALPWGGRGWAVGTAGASCARDSHRFRRVLTLRRTLRARRRGRARAAGEARRRRRRRRRAAAAAAATAMATAAAAAAVAAAPTTD